MQVLARQVGQFVGVLAWSRDRNGPRPVPVQMAHLESEPGLTSKRCYLHRLASVSALIRWQCYLCKWSGVRFVVLYSDM